MLKEYMLELGYLKEDYDLFKNDYILSRYEDEKILAKIKENFPFLLGLGYSKEDVIKITRIHPGLYGYSVETLKQKIIQFDKFRVCLLKMSLK